jgi:CHASE2 domain-containing sensor protein
MLAMLNLFDLWEVCVLGAGLARLAGATWTRATLPVLLVWMFVSAALGAVSALAVRLNS